MGVDDIGHDGPTQRVSSLHPGRGVKSLQDLDVVVRRIVDMVLD